MKLQSSIDTMWGVGVIGLYYRSLGDIGEEWCNNTKAARRSRRALEKRCLWLAVSQVAHN